MASKRSAEETQQEEMDFCTWTEDEIHELIQQEPPVAVRVMMQALAELGSRAQRLKEYKEELEKGLADLA